MRQDSSSVKQLCPETARDVSALALLEGQRRRPDDAVKCPGTAGITLTICYRACHRTMYRIGFNVDQS